MDIKRLYQTQELVTFTRLVNGEAWYVTTCGFEFPVPIAELGTAALLAQDKATLFVRYIRAYLKLLADAKTEQAAHEAA